MLLYAIKQAAQYQEHKVFINCAHFTGQIIFRHIVNSISTCICKDDIWLTCFIHTHVTSV